MNTEEILASAAFLRVQSIVWERRAKELEATLIELDANLENHQDGAYAQYQRRLIRAALAKVNS